MAFATSTPTVFAVIFCVWVIYLKSRRRSNLPPGPKGYPLVGSAFQLDRKRPWHTLVKWKKTYGDVVYLRLFNQDVVVLNSAKAASDLLDRRAANYSQRPRLVVPEHITGGLLLALMNVGPMWRSMRRASHEALNMRVSARYHRPQMREGIQLAMNMLDSPNDWRNHSQRFTASGITSILYNKPPLQSSQDPVTSFLDSVVDAISSACLPGKYLVNHLPFLESMPGFLAKWKRDSKEKHRIYSEEFLSLFLSVKETVLQKRETGPSFVASLVETQQRHGLDDKASAWLAAMLYLAGYETTATAMGWLILAMIAFPEAQHKVHEEIDRVVGRTRIPTLRDMDDLPYTRAVVKEVLRWRPPVPMGVFRTTAEDDIYNGYYIPKGSFIIPNVWAMNHDPVTYGPEADEFRPERFLNEDGTHKESPPDTKDEGHYSFGFGRRICPGRHLANNSVLTFAILLWAAHLEPGKDDFGRVEIPNVEDEAVGINSHVPDFRCSSRPRFPGAMEMLNLAKEEWF
ncbi:cytochrome p450 [Moniliophthora roreri MCA 2997]|uniref:Cytochrome p450 n=2 Tax=Moniliophthora roreri TaxID=221103 RepID=V2Y5S3_MONRO|nr:cytochrome p450 [Moniliophthora roreri MCA 2997]KAI3613570.1 cytochrome p450 [Moniliophthora roreri]